jgi:hypothetical protein
MTVGMLRRHEAAQERMLKAMLPRCGVVEYDNLLPRVPLTGRRWTAGNLVLLPKAQHLKAVR